MAEHESPPSIKVKVGNRNHPISDDDASALIRVISPAAEALARALQSGAVVEVPNDVLSEIAQAVSSLPAHEQSKELAILRREIKRHLA
jgi:hypothetical protein